MYSVTDIKPGTTLQIAGGLTARVIENTGDGEWLRVELLTGDSAGTQELCHATDVLSAE